MTAQQVGEIAKAGGRLIVTPACPDLAVTRAAKRHGMLAVPGFFTPTEAFALLAAGADALKLLPGGRPRPEVLRAMRAVLPARTAVLPVGGIDAANMAAWHAAGAAGYGIGSAIYKPGDTAAVVTEEAKTAGVSDDFAVTVQQQLTNWVLVASWDGVSISSRSLGAVSRNSFGSAVISGLSKDFFKWRWQ